MYPWGNLPEGRETGGAIVTWAAAQAEQWMREHPGRWLETTDGAVVKYSAATGNWLIAKGCFLQFYRTIDPATTFHPPREHYAAAAIRGETNDGQAG